VPEGDAVRRTARRLDRAMSGEVLQHTDFRVPRAATVDLSGATVVGTVVVGKHLLTRTSGRLGEQTIHSHLRMDGRWRTGRAAPTPCSGPAHAIRVWLLGERSQAVGTHLAEVAVLPTADEATWVGHLGPDVLADNFDAESLSERVAAQGGRGLVESLLDQTVVSGLGTMWAAELAHTARVVPTHAADDVPGLGAALSRTRQRMRRAILDDPRASRARLSVFERTGRSCPRCNGIIVSGRVGTPPRDRVTYWCPRCQD
jgi:endonuclease VIII